MTNYAALLNETRLKLLKALEHLNYSYNKIIHLPDNLAQMDEEIMQTWESFTVRFSRVSDIFIKHYVKTKIAIEEPGFKGTTRDYINKAEKLALIESAHQWIAIREIRNVSVHEYADEDLTALYQKLKSLCPTLLAIRQLLETL